MLVDVHSGQIPISYMSYTSNSQAHAVQSITKALAVAKALWVVFNFVLQAKTSLDIDCHENSNELDSVHAALHCCCKSSQRGKSLGGILSCPSDIGASAKSFMMVKQ